MLALPVCTLLAGRLVVRPLTSMPVPGTVLELTLFQWISTASAIACIDISLDRTTNEETIIVLQSKYNTPELEVAENNGSL